MKLKGLAFFVVAAALAAGPAAGRPAKTGKADREAQQAAAELDELDFVRLYEDKAYAAKIATRAASLRGRLQLDPADVARLDFIEAMALGGLARHDEAIEAARRGAAFAPHRGASWTIPVVAAAMGGREAAAIDFLASAAASVRDPAELAELRKSLDEDLVYWIYPKIAKDQPARERLSDALLALGWPSPDRASRLDSYRKVLVRSRLGRDPAAARDLAAQITDPVALVPLLVAKAYDPLFEGDAARHARLQAALRSYDAQTARLLAANPEDLDLLLDRAQFLRGAGREEEALALLRPAVADMEKVKEQGEKAFWLVNEAAYALQATGRLTEGVALMDKLLALGVEAHPALINMAINRIELVVRAGRPHDAAGEAERLFAERAGLASPYGQMWMWAGAACGHALAGNPAGAKPWIDRLAAASADNEAAHMRALLCAGDLDSAETLLLRRLEGEQSDEMLVTLQDYAGDHAAADARMKARFASLRERPAVAAAIARKGRILKLPLSRTYWGDF